MVERPSRSGRALLVAVALLAAAAGCRSRDLDKVGEPATPLILVLAPTHAAEPAELQELESFVLSRSGLAVTVRVADSQESAVVSAGGRGVDAWMLPLFDYLFARKEFGVSAGFQALRGDGSRTFFGEILVRADGGIAELAQLDGKRIAFVDPHSTSGFLFAAELLQGAGVETETTFAGSHEEALAALRAGRADAAATFAGAAAGDPSIRAIARTRDIPNEPIAFRAGLPDEIQRRLGEALTAFAATAEGKRVLESMAGITGFAPVEDSDYDDVRDAIRAAGKSSADLVPGGWRIYNQNRRIPGDYFP